MINGIKHKYETTFSKDVLIVEDDFLMTLLLEQYLRRLGNYVVRTANNGMDAIKVNKNYNPEVIIVSNRLRGELDGIQTTARIRSSSDTPVIYIRGDQEVEAEERLNQLPYVRLLTDPVTIEGLEEAFNALLSKKVPVISPQYDKYRSAAV